MTRMVTVSFPDITWRDEVGPIDGVTAVVWDPQEAPPQESVDVYIAPYMTKPAGVAVVADRLAQFEIELTGLRGMCRRLVERGASGPADASIVKLYYSELLQRLTDFGAEIGGPGAHTVLSKPMSSGWESGSWVLDFIDSGVDDPDYPHVHGLIDHSLNFDIPFAATERVRGELMTIARRKREGRRWARPPPARASVQVRCRCWRARVMPT